MNIKIIILIVGIVIGAVMQGVVGGLPKHNSYEEKELAYYKSTYLWKKGWTPKYGNYQLNSFDGGKNWYAVDIKDGSVTIKGTAEEISPGLLAELEAWDRLTKYAKENGPITLSGNRAAKDISVLTGTGFTFT